VIPDATGLLPPRWRWLAASEVGDVQLGRQRSPKNRSANFPTPYLRAANITECGLDVSDVLEMNFRPEERARYSLQAGDIILSEASGSASQVGKPAIWNGELPICCFQNTVIRMRPRGVDPRYLLWLFTHYYRSGVFAKVAGGVGINHLSAARFSRLMLPIAPPDEQRWIVDFLETQSSSLEAASASLLRAQAGLARYRAALLKAACEGRLIEGTSGWRTLPLGAAIQDMQQGWSPRCEREPARPDEWGVITTTAIQPLQFDDHQHKRLPHSLRPRPELQITAGDVLITRAGPRSRVGIACVVRSTRPRLIFCDKAYRLRCNPDVLLPEFLELILNAPSTREAIERLKTGINDSGLNLTQKRFGELPISFPSADDQREIVAAVEERVTTVDHIDDTVRAQLPRSVLLRQSILRAAFNGELLSRRELTASG
jgi:type I restriction enzyme, S subunit